MRAATERDAGERLQPEAALRLFTGEPQHPARTRRVVVGAVADLCLLHVPLRTALDALSRLGAARGCLRTSLPPARRHIWGATCLRRWCVTP